MTPGTIAVVAVLVLIVGAIIYSQIRNKKKGVTHDCGGCGACDSNCESQSCQGEKL